MQLRTHAVPCKQVRDLVLPLCFSLGPFTDREDLRDTLVPLLKAWMRLLPQAGRECRGEGANGSPPPPPGPCSMRPGAVQSSRQTWAALAAVLPLLHPQVAAELDMVLPTLPQEVADAVQPRSRVLWEVRADHTGRHGLTCM